MICPSCNSNLCKHYIIRTSEIEESFMHCRECGNTFYVEITEIQNEHTKIEFNNIVDAIQRTRQ